MRICDICGTIDDGPRHVIAHAVGEVDIRVDLIDGLVGYDGVPPEVRDAAIVALSDTTLEIRHPSCCARVGCDVCTEEN